MTTTDKPLLYFLQPSLNLIAICIGFLLVLIAVALLVPYPLEIRLPLLLTFIVCWAWQFNHSILLRHRHSIMCIGRDQQGWWLQRRNGVRIYGVLGAGTNLWQYFCVKEVRPAIWRWPVSVMLMSDSFESDGEFRSLKHELYVAAHQGNQRRRSF